MAPTVRLTPKYRRNGIIVPRSRNISPRVVLNCPRALVFVLRAWAALQSLTRLLATHKPCSRSAATMKMILCGVEFGLRSQRAHIPGTQACFFERYFAWRQVFFLDPLRDRSFFFLGFFSYKHGTKRSELVGEKLIVPGGIPDVGRGEARNEGMRDVVVGHVLVLYGALGGRLAKVRVIVVGRGA